MSIAGAQREVERKQEMLARLQNDKSKIATKIANESKKMDDAAKTITRTRSESTIKSKQRTITSSQTSIAKLQKELAAIESKISKATKDVNAARTKLTKAEVAESQRQTKALQKTAKETQRQIDAANAAINSTAFHQKKLEKRVATLEKLPDSITVLFLATSPKDLDKLRLDEEARELHNAIRKTEYRDTIRLETRWALRPIDVLEAINETNPTIIHFSGHGGSDGSIVLEDNNGNEKPIGLEAMAASIATTSDNTKLIVFNACYSATQAAQAIQYVDAAIGMTDTIRDTSAIAFASQLYSSIGYGKSLGSAFKQAKALLLMENPKDANVVRIYLAEGVEAEKAFYVQKVSS